MNHTEKMALYRQQLHYIATLIHKMADCDEEVWRLVYGENLLPVERGLRDFIEQFRD